MNDSYKAKHLQCEAPKT